MGQVQEKAGQLRFWVHIGDREQPRLSFGVMAPDAFTAQMQYLDLCQAGERIEVLPADGPVADECELIAADLQLSQHKAERFHRQNDRRALEAQVAAFREAGFL